MIHLLAPGPSMSQSLASSFTGQHVGVVGNCFELVPSALFLASSDGQWWDMHPQAYQFNGRKFSVHPHPLPDVIQIDIPTNTNSGVLALEVAKRLGFKAITLHGFDMHGTHYFGEYTNGLVNTREHTRRRHLQQYRDWALVNPELRVINATAGSMIDCFERMEAMA